MSSIVIEDQFGARPPRQAVILDWQDGVPCTVRDLIAERVRYEHDRVHLTADQSHLSANEIVYLPNNLRHDRISADEAVARALTAFGKTGFVLLVDGKQMSGLDDVVRLAPTTKVKFIKLLPLKGG